MSEPTNTPASPETVPTPPAPAPTSTPPAPTPPAAPAAPAEPTPPAPTPAPATPAAPTADNSALEATVAELKTEQERLKMQLTEAQNNPANPNSAEIGELNVKLNRMSILQESPEVAAKIKPILDKNPYAIWGTDEEMRDQINTMKGAMGIETKAPEGTPPSNGTNPTTPQAVTPPPVAQLSEDQLWAQPLDELEASIRSSGEVKYV